MLLLFSPLGSISEDVFWIVKLAGYILGWGFFSPLQMAINTNAQDLPKTSGFI